MTTVLRDTDRAGSKDRLPDERLRTMAVEGYFEALYDYSVKQPEHVLKMLDELFYVKLDLGKGLTPYFNPHIDGSGFSLDKEDIRIRLEIRSILPRTMKDFNFAVDGIMRKVDKQINAAIKDLKRQTEKGGLIASSGHIIVEDSIKRFDLI